MVYVQPQLQLKSTHTPFLGRLLHVVHRLESEGGPQRRMKTRFIPDKCTCAHTRDNHMQFPLARGIAPVKALHQAFAHDTLTVQ